MFTFTDIKAGFEYKLTTCLYLFRAKSIEWQEDRVVREMSCDSIKKEPVLQSNRVVREISIDRYQEEQRSNYAANTFEVD